MKIDNIPSGYAFARNPIIFSGDFPHWGNNDTLRLMVEMGGSLIFEGRVSAPVRVNLADIIDAYATHLPEVPAGNKSPICRIEGDGGLRRRKVRVWVENNEGDECEAIEFIALPGGISNQNYRRLSDAGSDIFSDRFFNREANVFLTTRSAGWSVTVKETEVSPLYFILPEETEVSIRELVGNNYFFAGELEPGVFALDVNALRLHFFEENKVLSSMFDIYLDDFPASRIVIERAQPALERYLVKFRNSLGVFDTVELVGDISLTPSYDNSAESMLQRYDMATDDFLTQRDRIRRTLSITAQTGPKRPEEVRLLMDMIASDEVYLLDLADYPVRIVPEPEAFKYSRRPGVPESFTVKFRLSDTDINIMPDIESTDQWRRPRVFSTQFNNIFH